jgi:hypothetical protein
MGGAGDQAGQLRTLLVVPPNFNNFISQASPAMSHVPWGVLTPVSRVDITSRGLLSSAVLSVSPCN